LDENEPDTLLSTCVKNIGYINLFNVYLKLNPHYMQKRKLLLTIALVLVSFTILLAQGKKSKDKKGSEPATTTVKSDSAKSKKPTIKGKVASSKKIPGLFVLYQDTATGSLQLYIDKKQLGKDFIYQSFSMGGPPELFLNQNMIRETWLFTIQKNFDKIGFVRKNTNFYFDPTNAISKAANADVSEAQFYSVKIEAEDSTGYLIKADGLFISEKLDPIKPSLPPSLPPGTVLNLGTLSSSKSYYLKLRSFPKNTDVIVSLAYENPSPINFGGKDITDARFVQVKMQHSFIEAPDNDYKPRFDDPRVGFFTQEVDDMTAMGFPNYRDMINRWHLTKKDPNAALSEPVEPIVWWVENTTPVEVRDIIMKAGLKWNEAFEKAGFKNAVVMKQMPDTATWDPADIRYNVLRWVSSDLGYAIGPSFVDPRTGQILGADITFDFSFLPGMGYEEELFGSISSPTSIDELLNFNSSSYRNCSIGRGKQMIQQGALTMADAFSFAPEELATLKEQYLTELVLHEMGHTLGLNHNMKSSTMLSPKDINNREITRRQGLTGSVMDYAVVNLVSDRSKQGDYYTTKPGPYDLWAIEFGYAEFAPNKEKESLAKILNRSHEPELTFGNDADITFPGRGVDPRVMVWDMSSDMVAYAEDRFKTVNKAMGQIKSKFVQDGKSYQQLTTRYSSLFNQRAIMIYGLANQIGGIYVDRSFPEQKSTNKPLTPVPASYQKSAMRVLSTYILSPRAFDADKELYAYLQRQRRGFNFGSRTEDPKIIDAASNIYQTTFQFILNPTTLKRANSTTLYGNTYTDADIMADLVKASFSEDLGGSVNAFRQSQQNILVNRLIGIATDTKMYEPAAQAAAYYTLKNLKSTLNSASGGDTQTKAHRSHLLFTIEKGLSTAK